MTPMPRVQLHLTYKTFLRTVWFQQQTSIYAAMGSIILFYGKGDLGNWWYCESNEKKEGKEKKTDLKRWKWKIVGGTKTCLL